MRTVAIRRAVVALGAVAVVALGAGSVSSAHAAPLAQGGEKSGHWTYTPSAGVLQVSANPLATEFAEMCGDQGGQVRQGSGGVGGLFCGVREVR